MRKKNDILLKAAFEENPMINNNFEKQIESLTGNKNPMGIIETIKMLEREEGFELGVEQNRYTVVTNLLQANQFTNAQIANFAGVTEAFVVKVKNDLNLENN